MLKIPIIQVCEDWDTTFNQRMVKQWRIVKLRLFHSQLKAPAGRTKYDVSAIEQLETYKMFMENYIDHNCSITVHVRENEWDDVEQWVWDHWDDVVALSFLALDDHFYAQAPYETIDEEIQ